MAGRVTAKCVAISPAGSSRVATSRRISRRFGSASARMMSSVVVLPA
jgi:hypothetical protein